MNRISPNIRADELHVWIADLDAGDEKNTWKRRQEALSADERERAARFVNRRNGERWAHSRALLRLMLGWYMDAGPATLCFELGEHGKPRLAFGADRADKDEAQDTQLHFNLSHSGGYGLYVFALDCEVGVDVEMPGRNIDVLAVAERALGGEVAERLRLLDEQQREREFLRAWVRHEARLKCLGMGLGGTTRADEHECWMVDVDLGEQATAAVATKHALAKVECRRWDFAASEPVSDRAVCA